MNCYAMFYLDEVTTSQSQNGIAGPAAERVRTFVLCCRNLNKTLHHYNPDLRLTVVTNSEATIQEFAPELPTQLIRFDLVIPVGIKSYSHHRKIDVFKWLSENAEGYSVLLDPDVTCINPMPLNLRCCIDQNVPTYYDVSDQIYPDYGRERIIRDKNRLSDLPSVGLWAGGEYLGGDRDFFAELHERTARISARYFEIYDEMCHKGDETQTSVAIEDMLRRGRYICDVGKLGVIGRYWSSTPRHVQRPFPAYADHFLVHLPMDKAMLSAPREPGSFIGDYMRYLRRKRSLVRRLLRRLGRMIHG